MGKVLRIAGATAVAMLAAVTVFSFSAKVSLTPGEPILNTHIYRFAAWIEGGQLTITHGVSNLWLGHNSFRLPGVLVESFTCGCGDWRRNIVIGLWAPIILIATSIGLSWTVSRLHERRRQTASRCVRCAYDLRGSGGICPECGTANAANASTMVLS